MRVIVLNVLSLFFISSACAQDESYNTITTTSLDANNPTSIRILGQNDPVGTVSARNISFDFNSAGKAQIQAYRNNSMGTTLQFLTNDDGDQVGSAPSIRMQISQNGKVGIGTLSPQAPLHVNGDQILNGNLVFGADQMAFFIKGPANGGAIRIRSNGSSTSDRGIQFGNIDNNGSWNSYMTVEDNGNVGIGTPIPNSKLAVNGNVRAREVKVENNNWPDYVFTKDYPLPSLQQTEQHIKEKGHLPGIPSAAEVKANGIDLGEMNAKLLQKIEELTLHLIEKEKAISDQNKRIEKLEAFNEKLSTQNHLKGRIVQ